MLKTFPNYHIIMDEPRVPDNDKNWNEIDIFIFSNGQKHSPPRKYHLQSEELEFWEATIIFLARSQYGSMHSKIELYTLDGTKIRNPLELIDAASYVAVKPPDTFIPAGYERYLIKASRSWEKRQEKLTNAADTTDEPQITKGHPISAVDEFKAVETPNIQGPQGIMEKDLDSIGTNNTIIDRLRKENERSFDEKSKIEKPFVNKKSIDSFNNKNLKKVSPQISKNNAKDNPILNKKRNIPAPKNNKCSSSRRQSILSKTEKSNAKMSIDNNPKEKIQPNLTKSLEHKEVKERIVLSLPNSINENQSQEGSNKGPTKGLRNSSDVYKNPDSEVQSVYIDANQRNSAKDKDKYKSNELHKIIELNNEFVDSIKANKAISIQSLTCSDNKHGQEINTSIVSKAKMFNIKLNIDVRDYRDANAIDKSGNLGKCKSHTALLTGEQGSQANNINLNDDNLKHEDNMSQMKSFLSNKAGLKSDLGDAKVIVVNCKCGLSEAQTLTDKNKDNYILLIPSTFADKNIESCRCNPDKNQPADKDSLKSRHSILNWESLDQKINPASKENSQTIIKHKVSICPDSPIKISVEIPSESERNIFNVVRSTVPMKTDQFTQTEWRNILLEARPQANGHFSFHLPPLRVLAQYNLL